MILCYFLGFIDLARLTLLVSIMNSYFKQLKKLQKNAYAPYSNFHVASILVLENGSEFSGVNVENASYGATICAERSALVSAISQQGVDTTFRELHLLAGKGENFPMPCGLCRQFIAELTPADFNIVSYNPLGEYKIISSKELLPYAFLKNNLHLSGNKKT